MRPVMRRAVAVPLAVVVPLIAGCGLLPESPVCVDMLPPAVQLVITDSVSGARLTSAMAVVRDGAYVDTARAQPVNPEGPLHAAYSRPGIYSVEVNHAGYRQWQRDAVRPGRGSCGLEAAMLDVRMQPLAP